MRQILLLTAFLMMVPRILVAEDASPSQPVDAKNADTNIIERLLSRERSARLGAAAELDSQRTHLVEKLISVLESTNSDAIKIDAVIVLGEYRATKAVPVLLRNLQLEPNAKKLVSVNSSDPSEALEEVSLPVTTALTKIGVPAVPSLLDRIVEMDDTNLTRKCLAVCVSIEGEEVTQFRLKELMEMVSDQKEKARVQYALETLKGLNESEIARSPIAQFLDVVRQSDDEDTRLDFVDGCVEKYGWVETRFRLKALLERETDQDRRDRIQSALEYLEKLVK